ncbi:molybdenum cofactor guanylyltransferase [Ekhidna sp.]
MQDDLNGLILMGGNSVRMGMDKSSIQYHEKPQGEHLFDLLNPLVRQCYISLNKEPKSTFTNQIIVDLFDVKGPLNGILSAHEFQPSKAWLVLAVDLPLINSKTLSRLISQRDKEAPATAFLNVRDNFPEPLVAIWEPKGLRKLKELYVTGNTLYPRNFLHRAKTKLINAETENELLNVNSKSDLKLVRSILSAK